MKFLRVKIKHFVIPAFWRSGERQWACIDREGRGELHCVCVCIRRIEEDDLDIHITRMVRAASKEV